MAIFPRFTLVALLAGALSSSKVVSADDDRKIVYDIQDLEYDENGKLASHVVLYPAGDPYCQVGKLDATEGFQFYPVLGEALQAVFPGASESSCQAACMEKGTDRSVAHAAMPHKHWDGTGKFKPWFAESCQKVEVCFLNYYSKIAKLPVNWIHPETGERKLHMEIKFGEHGTRCFHSYVGHKFVAVDPVSGEDVEEVSVQHTTTKAFGVSPPNSDPRGHNFDVEIENTLVSSALVRKSMPKIRAQVPASFWGYAVD